VTWGPSKAEALGHVFGEVRDDRRWPVQRTRRPGAAWIVDEAAAAKIPADLRG
jgi:6-phosphogluconolactonase/glucosamine-6-phosphate isomerase/deaminase